MSDVPTAGEIITSDNLKPIMFSASITAYGDSHDWMEAFTLTPSVATHEELTEEEAKQLLQRVFSGVTTEVGVGKVFKSSKPNGELAPAAAGGTGCWAAWVRNPVRITIFNTLSYPETSKVAMVSMAVTTSLIVLSVLAFILETLPMYNNDHDEHTFWIIETITVAGFTMEYCLRLATCENWFRFIIHPFNIIDLVAILPYYVELIVGGSGASKTRILRILRLFRILRLLRIASKTQRLQVVGASLVASADLLLILLVLLVIIIVICSSLMYFAEHNRAGSLYSSIPATMWWAQVTLTTTGYGEMVPLSPLGKFLAGCSMLVAVAILALPISVLGANFTNLWTQFKQVQRLKDNMHKVLPDFKHLQNLLSQHKEAMADVMGFTKDGQSHIDDDIVYIKEECVSGRLLARANQASVHEEELQELKDLCLRSRQRLFAARRRYHVLSKVLDAGGTVEAEELVARLDKLYLAYKHLSKWFDEGLTKRGEVQRVISDMGQLKTMVESIKDLANTDPSAARHSTE